jgi:thiol-disulfide isomerase/thioredoxin
MKTNGPEAPFLLNIAFAMLVASLILLSTPVSWAQQEPAVFRALAAGDAAPDISVVPVDGGEETVISFGGGDNSKAPALVWFWFISCENCVKDMKFMRGIQKNYKKDISFVAVNVDKPSERGSVMNFLKNNGISGYQNFFDKITENTFSVSYDASDKFGINRTPAIFIIDKTGKIIFSAESDIDFDEVEKNIETAIKKGK